MAAKKVLIINGHPDEQSFNFALSLAYAKGARSSGAEVKTLNLRDLDFRINLSQGYREKTELEPDLLKAQELLKWSEHIVLVFPVWWGSVPALLKGFFDRALLPGFAFQYRKDSVWWDKLLKGRSGRIISTLDQPAWYYRWINGRPTYHHVKKMTLEFTGIKPVRSSYFGPIRNSKPEKREKWLAKVEGLGRSLK